MGNLKDIGIRNSYTGKGSVILNEFLMPALNEAVSYDRVTSFYSIDSLLAISQGVQMLYERSGKMRLIIGVHSFPPELVDAELRREYIQGEIKQVRDEINNGLATISDELSRKRVATLAWMIEDGLLSVKVAAVEGEGIFHPKTLILKDDDGGVVAAVGSSNETGSGLGGNFEQLVVLTSWEMPDAITDQEQYFETLWVNENEAAIVSDITEDLAEIIYDGLGNAYRNRTHASFASSTKCGVVASAAKMPANFFVSGEIPALFQHQERAVIDALSRWPVRVLFGDEVGLGKTFETAATMAFLIKYCGINRVLILTPKAVLQQWQDELSNHFGINAWRFDSASKAYIDCEGNSKPMGNANPIGKNSPSIMLISAQYARGGAGREDIFCRSGSFLPDLLVVDEAHSARVSSDISGNKKATRMYRMLEEATRRIPHLILATATPMQRDASEYHAMLKLIGLPKPWQKERSYIASLELITQENEPDSNNAFLAGKLLRSTVTMMHPSLDVLEPEEKEALEGLLNLGDEVERFSVASYVQSSWRMLHKVFIKLHPAHLLTVRNTRRSLEDVGYVFPQRNLEEESVLIPDSIRLFYLDVNKYIENDCFSVERALDTERKINVGFVRVSYQQRVASSLYSCKMSLQRRLEKILHLKDQLESEGKMPVVDISEFSSGVILDDFDDDELLISGGASADDFGLTSGADIGALISAISIESMRLPGLIKRASELMDEVGDPKINRSVALAKEHLSKRDTVLLFSRYTDTVDALVAEFCNQPSEVAAVYGVYIGQKSVIVRNGEERVCTKQEIKKELSEGDLSLMFCSDAASEGLNLQAARVLINVDVPWTPARLEQRIGRVARLGQRAKSVDIYNVWYPDSIEARMYHRINKRQKEANIAVGEFPDVVAEGIKNIVLEGREQDDNSLAVLQEMRNSVQTQALGKLWSVRGETETTSQYLRQGIMDICDRELSLVSADDAGTFKTYESPSGCISLTALEGNQESVSYQSLLACGIDYALDDLICLNDQEGFPCAFAERNNASHWIGHEFVAEYLLRGVLPSDSIKREWPKMLPCTTGLDLGIAVDCEVHKRPVFWPPISKEQGHES